MKKKILAVIIGASLFLASATCYAWDSGWETVDHIDMGKWNIVAVTTSGKIYRLDPKQHDAVFLTNQLSAARNQQRQVRFHGDGDCCCDDRPFFFRVSIK